MLGNTIYNLVNVYTLAETCRWTDAKDQLNLLTIWRSHCYAELSNSLKRKQTCNCKKCQHLLVMTRSLKKLVKIK